MQARVGDRITMAAEHVGQSTREGVIREVKGEGGAPPTSSSGPTATPA